MVFIQEALAAIQVQVPVKVQAQVQVRAKVLGLGTLVILQKVPAQTHLIAVVPIAQVVKTIIIIQAVVVKQKKGVSFQYLFQYHLVIAAMEEVIMVLA